MKDILRLGLILLLVTAVAGAALSVVNNITKPFIEYNKRKAKRDALTKVLSNVDSSKTIAVLPDTAKLDSSDILAIPVQLENQLYYEGYVFPDTTTQLKSGDIVIVPVKQQQQIYYKGFVFPDTTKTLNYAFEAKEIGYSDTIKTMVGIDTTGIIIGLMVLEQKETPGLGTKVADSSFLNPFLYRTWQDIILGKKEDGYIEAVTGATISSQTVANSIINGLKKLEENLGGFKEAKNE